MCQPTPSLPKKDNYIFACWMEGFDMKIGIEDGFVEEFEGKTKRRAIAARYKTREKQDFS